MTSRAHGGAGSGSDETWVRIGVVGRPHGVKGGAHLRLDNPDSDLLEAGIPLQLRRAGKAPRPVVITDVYGPGLVRLEGVDDRDAVARHTGDEVFARREDFPPLDDDEAYLVDLIGAEVRHKDGHRLGEVVALSDNGAQPLLEVRREGGGGDIALVPFVPGIVVDVDEEARVIILDPPEGLIEGDAIEADSEGEDEG